MTGARCQVVVDCDDPATGQALLVELESALAVADGGPMVTRHDEGPTTWSLVVGFADSASAERFFTGTAYRRLAAAVSDRCGGAVVRVPLEAPDR